MGKSSFSCKMCSLPQSMHLHDLPAWTSSCCSLMVWKQFRSEPYRQHLGNYQKPRWVDPPSLSGGVGKGTGVNRLLAKFGIGAASPKFGLMGPRFPLDYITGSHFLRACLKNDASKIPCPFALETWLRPCRHNQKWIDCFCHSSLIQRCNTPINSGASMTVCQLALHAVIAIQGGHTTYWVTNHSIQLTSVCYLFTFCKLCSVFNKYMPIFFFFFFFGCFHLSGIATADVFQNVRTEDLAVFYAGCPSWHNLLIVGKPNQAF